MIARFEAFFLCMFFFHIVGHSASYGCIMDPAAMGARSAGMGSAVVALADDVISALYFNPAGLTQLEGANIAMGSLFIENRIRYKSPDGYSAENSAPGVVPFVGYSNKLSDKVTMGFAAFSTLGVGFKFRNHRAGMVVGDIKSMTGVMTLAPTVSYKVNPKFSVGLQAQLAYSASEIDMPTPVGYLRTDSDGFGFAPAVGLLYQPTSFLSLGIRWRSPMKTHLEGDADLFTTDGQEQDDSLDLDLYWPQMLEFGAAFTIRPDLIFSVFAKWSDWSHFDKSKFKFRNMRYLDTPVASEMKDGVRWGIGAEYKPRANLALRCGYFHNPYSVESESLSPLIADLSYEEVRFGVLLELGKFDIGAVVNYTFFHSRNGTGDYPGRYTGSMPVGVIEIGYQF
ncbi:MAG: outer membrane protein transport protein [Thermodesulfobacteriota bacterium]|nr:outer membrane protein transport protein [Thermodesulfobacteriota bacterium]